MTSEREDLAELGRYAFARLRDRLEGLTDAECGWSPAPGVPSIAWRTAHIADLLADARNARWLAVPEDRGAPAPSPAADAAGALDAGGAVDAAGALAALEDAFAAWQAVLSAVPAGSLAAAIGPVGGPYAASTRRAFVLHVLDELVHHGAEAALLRDLWAARGAG